MIALLTILAGLSVSQVPTPTIYNVVDYPGNPLVPTAGGRPPEIGGGVLNMHGFQSILSLPGNNWRAVWAVTEVFPNDNRSRSILTVTNSLGVPTRFDSLDPLVNMQGEFCLGIGSVLNLTEASETGQGPVGIVGATRILSRPQFRTPSEHDGTFTNVGSGFVSVNPTDGVFTVLNIGTDQFSCPQVPDDIDRVHWHALTNDMGTLSYGSTGRSSATIDGLYFDKNLVMDLSESSNTQVPVNQWFELPTNVYPDFRRLGDLNSVAPFGNTSFSLATQTYLISGSRGSPVGPTFWKYDSLSSGQRLTKLFEIQDLFLDGLPVSIHEQSLLLFTGHELGVVAATVREGSLLATTRLILASSAENFDVIATTDTSPIVSSAMTNDQARSFAFDSAGLVSVCDDNPTNPDRFLEIGQLAISHPTGFMLNNEAVEAVRISWFGRVRDVTVGDGSEGIWTTVRAKSDLKIVLEPTRCVLINATACDGAQPAFARLQSIRDFAVNDLDQYIVHCKSDIIHVTTPPASVVLIQLRRLGLAAVPSYGKYYVVTSADTSNQTTIASRSIQIVSSVNNHTLDSLGHAIMPASSTSTGSTKQYPSTLTSDGHFITTLRFRDVLETSVAGEDRIITVDRMPSSVADITGISSGTPTNVPDGAVTTSDLQAFAIAYASGNYLADVTGSIAWWPDGTFNEHDCTAFLLAYARAMPATCLADLASDSLDSVRNPNGFVGPEDLDAFIAGFTSSNPCIADVASDTLDTSFNPNGSVGPEDLDAFVTSFVAGC